MAYLGVTIDQYRNDSQVNEVRDDDADISAMGTPVRTVVITAREDLQIAREARSVLNAV